MKRTTVFFFFFALLSACENDGTSDAVEDPKAPPAEGVQFQLVTELGPGAETERCKFIVAPRDLAVQHQVTRYGAGAHHILLYTTAYPTIPTVTRRGRTIDTTGVFECPSPNADWELDGVIGGTQSPGSPDIGANLPRGVAYRVKAGAVLLLNVHMLNAGAAPLAIDVRMNLHTVDPQAVQHEAGTTFFYNLFIKVPPMGKSSSRMSCPARREITLLNAQSHMHKRGVGASATLVGPDGQRERIYESQSWEAVPVATWPEGKRVAAGSAFDYQCDYEGREARTVMQGLTSKDEMCMIIGAYYPRDDAFEHCDPDGPRRFISQAATFIGTGTKNGEETLRCLASNRPFAGPPPSFTEGYTSCVLDSCEKIAPEMSGAIRCQTSQGFGGCVEACSDPARCAECIRGACAEQMAALAQAKCE